jgi:hypothetical protein
MTRFLTGQKAPVYDFQAKFFSGNHLHGAYARRVYTNALPKQRHLDLKLGSKEPDAKQQL